MAALPFYPAPSAIAAEISLTSGTGTYVFFNGIANFWRFDDVLNTGALVLYKVRADDGQIEVAYGTFVAPDQLQRGLILKSTNGNAQVDWPETGQRTIELLTVGIPLCPTVPMDGQVLIWDEAEQNWCPGDIPPPPPTSTPTNCGVDMQNVDSGTTYTVTIIKCETQVIWNSPNPGEKDTTIAAVGANQDGYVLHIKANTGDGSVHCVIPTGATIGGLSSDTFDDSFCDLSLVYNHAKTDWMIRCLCCYTPEPCPVGVPPPSPDSTMYQIEQGFALGPFSIQAKEYFGGLSTDRASVVIVNVVAQQNTQVSLTTPSVASVTSPNLSFQQRMASQTMSPDFCGLNPGPCEATMETWWAPAPAPLDHEIITVTFNSGGVATAIANVVAFYDVSDINDPWDTSITLPAVASNPTSTSSPAQVSAVSTDQTNSLILVFGMGTSPHDDVRFGKTVQPPTYLGIAVSQAFIGIDTSATFGMIATSLPLSNCTVIGPWLVPLFNIDGSALQWMVAVDAIRYPFNVASFFGTGPADHTPTITCP